ncbi:MAG: flagellar assembly protein FliW [Pseudomonadota bacterium]
MEVVRLETKGAGTVKVSEDSIITMPRGMIGFPSHTRFVLLPHRGDSPFLWLQSLEDPGLAWVTMNPLLLRADYKIRVCEAELDGIGPIRPRQLRVLAVVNIPAGAPETATVNLAGPIVINEEKRLAKQMVLKQGTYSHCQPLFQ